MRTIFSGLTITAVTSLTATSLSLFTTPAQADQRVCVITDNGATVCGRLTQQKPKKSNTTSSSGDRKEVGELTYLLKGCRRQDTTIKCNLLITNNGAETSLILNGSSSVIIDSVGKSHAGTSAELGGRGGTSVLSTVSPGINYEASITFDNIPEQMAQAPLLKLSTNFSASALQFRNVSFSIRD